MISVEELFKSNKYPKWISGNDVFSKIEYIRKIFPTIGLPNFEDKTIADNSKEITTFANHLLDLIADSLHERATTLTTFSKTAKIGKKRRQNLLLILSVMDSLNKQLRNNKAAFISFTANGKATLSIPEDISYDNKVFLKKGAGLFKIYEKLNTMLKYNKFRVLTELAQTYQFKNFSSINIPSKEVIIRFASDGEDGAWDIATMSMRGINSCQTWDQGAGGNSLKIIGSLVDPFTAIIYLTSGDSFNQFGSKMVRRCIVRYVINRSTKEPFLLLEKMYPAFDKPSLDSFVRAISARVPKIEIRYSADLGGKATTYGSALQHVYVPLSDELKMLDARYYPYCDSALSFVDDKECELAKNTQAVHASFKKRIPTLFQKAIQSRAFTKENVKQYGKVASTLMTKLRSKKLPTEQPEQQEQTTNVVDLSNRFVDFVCKKTEADDPFNYVKQHEEECKEFFSSEFGKETNTEFVNFVTSKVFDYIGRKAN